jgi:hypothetical protein
MDEAKALQIILAGIRQATNVRVHTQRPFPFEFRAYCTFDVERGHLVVTTVVRGDSNITRKHKRRATRETRRDQTNKVRSF